MTNDKQEFLNYQTGMLKNGEEYVGFTPTEWRADKETILEMFTTENIKYLNNVVRKYYEERLQDLQDKLDDIKKLELLKLKKFDLTLYKASVKSDTTFHYSVGNLAWCKVWMPDLYLRIIAFVTEHVPDVIKEVFVYVETQRKERVTGCSMFEDYENIANEIRRYNNYAVSILEPNKRYAVVNKDGVKTLYCGNRKRNTQYRVEIDTDKLKLCAGTSLVRTLSDSNFVRKHTGSNKSTAIKVLEKVKEVSEANIFELDEAYLRNIITTWKETKYPDVQNQMGFESTLKRLYNGRYDKELASRLIAEILYGKE